MIGTSPENRGGISSVVQSYRSAGLLDRWHVRYLTTHSAGSRIEKALRMAAAVLRFAPWLVRRPAFVHVHMATRASFWRKLVFVALARARRIPILLHVHGGHFGGYYADAGRIKRFLIRWSLEAAHVVVALTPSWATMFREIAPRAEVVVVPNPVPIPAIEAPQPRDERTLLFLGRLTHEKGVDVLLDGFAQAVRRYPDAVLLIGAPGDARPIEQRLRELGIEGNVRFLGWVDGERKQALLATATVFVLPSRAEGLPVGMLEAMAYGMPVIVSRVGGVPDALTDGVEGLIVPIGDADAFALALCELLGDPARRERMGAMGRQRVSQEFDLPSVVARMEALYERLLRPGARA